MIDEQVVLQILISWAEGDGPRYYADLSGAYQSVTNEWHEPHGSWDVPLGNINNRLYADGAPPISALVFTKQSNEPGGNFWGSAPNVPARPSGDERRLEVLYGIIDEVRNFDWSRYR